MTSALRITIGTIGMPADIAIRNGPFLNGPTSVVSSRVPSGAIRIDRPLRASSSTFFSPSTAALRVVAVDERRVHHLAHRADDRIVLQFLLADRREVVADQPARDDRVDLVAVVEDEHRGPLRGQVLLAEHVEVDAGGGQQRSGRTPT